MWQKYLNSKTILLVAVIVAAGLYLLQVISVPEHVLDDVVVTEEGSLMVLHVKTLSPMRYENHYPEGPSSFIQIKMRSIALMGADKNEVMGNESILPGFIEQVPITEVAYEGNVPGGPFISLRFKDPISYKIKEDPDYHGVMIYIPKKSKI